MNLCSVYFTAYKLYLDFKKEYYIYIYLYNGIYIFYI